MKHCIKCGNPINDPRNQYRTGIAAKKCENCLFWELANQIEALAAKQGNIEYLEEGDHVRVRGFVKGDVSGEDDPNRAVGRYRGKE